MKAIGIPSLAVFESSLHELAMHRRIQMLTSEEAALLAGEAVRADQNYTYVLFNGAEEALQLRPLIEQASPPSMRKSAPGRPLGAMGLSSKWRRRKHR